jgi:hypothetical protein
MYARENIPIFNLDVREFRIRILEFRIDIIGLTIQRVKFLKVVCDFLSF